jgi:hypothetical protein
MIVELDNYKAKHYLLAEACKCKLVKIVDRKVLSKCYKGVRRLRRLSLSDQNEVGVVSVICLFYTYKNIIKFKESTINFDWVFANENIT